MDVDIFRIPELLENEFNVVEFFSRCTFTEIPENELSKDRLKMFASMQWIQLPNEQNMLKIEAFMRGIRLAIHEAESKYTAKLPAWTPPNTDEIDYRRELLIYICNYDSKEWFWKLSFVKDWITYSKPYPSGIELHQQAVIREKCCDCFYEMVAWRKTGAFPHWTHYSFIFTNRWVPFQHYLMSKKKPTRSYAWNPYTYARPFYIINPIQ